MLRKYGNVLLTMPTRSSGLLSEHRPRMELVYRIQQQYRYTVTVTHGLMTPVSKADTITNTNYNNVPAKRMNTWSEKSELEVRVDRVSCY